MIMKHVLQELFAGVTLAKDQAKELLRGIATGQYNDYHITSFLTVFMMRCITVEELDGFREALLELCEPVHLGNDDTMDMCGTGGDGKDTFNISTTAMFVVAGAGIPITKHGNYGVSSSCGSSNVLQALGHAFTNNHDAIRRSLEQSGVCFLHAPLFHPAMKAVGHIRTALGLRTFFNMLGPLVNPAFPKKQLTGVFSMELARIYSYILQNTDIQYMIVRSFDGYDEISLTGRFKLVGNSVEIVGEPSLLGLPRYDPNELRGGRTPDEGAKILMNVLKGEGTPAQEDVVCANAGVAIHCARPNLSLPDAVQVAREAIRSGKALSVCTKFLALS